MSHEATRKGILIRVISCAFVDRRIVPEKGTLSSKQRAGNELRPRKN